MKDLGAILLIVSLLGCTTKGGDIADPETDVAVDAMGEDMTGEVASWVFDMDAGTPTTVGVLVGQVSEHEIAGTIAALSNPESGGFSTRYTGSPGFGDVTAYLAGRCEALDLETSLQHWEEEIGGTAYAAANVICEVSGAVDPGTVVLIGAHYDSVTTTPPFDPAPGAGDNGSGVAAALELARVLSEVTPAVTLRFVFFAGEEQGFLGSFAYLDRLGDEGIAAVELMLNLDQVGRINDPGDGDFCTDLPGDAGAPGELGVCLESFAAHGDLLDEIQGAGVAYTTLYFRRNLAAFGSDHVPFLLAGVPAFLAIEAYDGANPVIHSTEDVYQAVDLDLVAEIARLGVAVVALRVGVAP